MGRHGYTDCIDDNWAMIQWRGRVAASIKGARGQAMLHDLLAALDAMPEKALVKGSVVTKEGDCCAIGALLIEREPHYLESLQESSDDEYALEEFNELIADDLDVAEPLIQEIAWENDGHWGETPEDRWKRMRRWVASKIKEAPDADDH